MAAEQVVKGAAVGDGQLMKLRRDLIGRGDGLILTYTVLDVRLEESRLVELPLKVGCQPDFAQGSSLGQDDVRVEHDD